LPLSQHLVSIQTSSVTPASGHIVWPVKITENFMAGDSTRKPSQDTKHFPGFWLMQEKSHAFS
ncbi:MAG: hypothetical protein JAY95_07495, partial [Candidatus Thiodiazotropha taylori]|nr:hypothetical protein [Candidatus Thiodiazotropha taylori]